MAPRVCAIAVVAALVAACTGAASASLPPIPSEPPATPTPAPTHPGPTYPPACPASQPAPLAAGETRTVTLTTDKGAITIRVEGSLSPIATGNFVALASCGYYDNVVFHRVVPGFVIQAGDGEFGRTPWVIPDLVGTGGPPYKIKDEKVTGTYARGTVAMARTMAPDSASSQFFIVLSDSATPALAKVDTYQILGHVTAGLDVVDGIAAAAAGKELPDTPVVITAATVTNP